MAASLADRATSDLLVGSDWAMNVEICDILNHDPGQGKDTARVLRRRICNKSPKIQLLALTLLETIIRNCGDIVHMHIAERDIPHKMVKIVKKKPDFHVKEKILVLIDTWQEAFGGPNARHPQYFAAYQELLRAGVVFPKRPPRSAPVFNPQGKPSISHAEPLSNSNHQEAATESSASSELHVLSLTDIQNARGIMDVLEEMLSALDPNNKEGVRQEVIVDLVEQCRLFRQRLVHLVSATSDEALLHQGLQLNDDLQRLLAKYDQLAGQIAHHPEKPTTLQALVDVEDSTVNNQDNHTKANSRTITSTSSNNQPGHASISDPFIDLLSGDNPDVTSTETSLALAPVGELPSSSTSEPNILALSDVFSQNNNNTNSTNPTSAFDLQSASPAAHLALVPVASRFPPESQQTAEPILYSNGTVASPGMPQHEQVGYSEAIQWNHAHALWNDQSGQGMNPQQQAYNNGSVDQSGAFPPPPWEVQPMTGDQLTTSQYTPMLGGQLGDIPAVESVQSSQPGSVHHPFMQGSQPESIHPTVLQNNQPVGTYPSSIQSNGLGASYPQQMPGLQLQGPDPRLKGSAQLGGTYAQPMLGAQLGGIYPLVHPGAQIGSSYTQVHPGAQLGGAYPQAHPGAQLGGAYTHARPGIQFGGFTYSQQPDAQFYYQRPAYPPLGPNDISEGIYGLSMQDRSMHTSSGLSRQMPTPSYVHQPMRPPSKPEDKLFGDLVSLAKTKQNKPTV